MLILHVNQLTEINFGLAPILLKRGDSICYDGRHHISYAIFYQDNHVIFKEEFNLQTSLVTSTLNRLARKGILSTFNTVEHGD